VTCLVCGADDGLALLCGRHWSEFVRWDREHEASPAESDDKPRMMRSVFPAHPGEATVELASPAESDDN
jgi:hypothetical protein